MCLYVAAALSLLPQPLARLVKCMAATTAVYALQSEEVMEHEEVPDVYSDSGEVISDGCCYASYKSLQLLHDAMQLQQQGGRERPTLAGLLESEPSGHLPSSAVQVRLGGIKGMYSLKMGIEGRRLFWRKSMKKFDAESAQLEVCEWARWLPVIHDWRSKDEPLTSSALPPPLSLLRSPSSCQHLTSTSLLPRPPSRLAALGLPQPLHHHAARATWRALRILCRLAGEAPRQAFRVSHRWEEGHSTPREHRRSGRRRRG